MRKRVAAEMAARSRAASGEPYVSGVTDPQGPADSTGTLPFELTDDSPPSSDLGTATATETEAERHEKALELPDPEAQRAEPSEAVSGDALLHEARTAADTGELERAKAVYEELLTSETVSVQTRREYAEVLDRAGYWEDALDVLGLCLEEDPGDIQVLVSRGAIHASHGHYHEAERDLRDALRMESTSAEAHLNLGLVAVRKGLWAEATPYLRRAVELDAGLAAAHFYLAEALNHVDDLEGALQSYQRAAELRPTSPEAFYGLGIVLDRLNRPDDAAQMYRRSREVAGR
jgi:tetratricopeptide (TPR) repeat protein